MKVRPINEILSGNSYPGRGVLMGKSPSGKYAVTAYFIMGRSENSRNRVFTRDGEGIRTEAFDPDKLTDPSLVIYAPVRVLDDVTIVTNGDQTDTIFESLTKGGSFEDALRTRSFEPDGPNWTPRISGLMVHHDGNCSYKLSILKSAGGNDACCERFFYEYDRPIAGEGRLIHTYLHDGNPIPSFEGEPVSVALPESIDEFTNLLWDSLDRANKISLFVRYIPLEGQKAETRIINKNVH